MPGPVRRRGQGQDGKGVAPPPPFCEQTDHRPGRRSGRPRGLGRNEGAVRAHGLWPALQASMGVPECWASSYPTRHSVQPVRPLAASTPSTVPPAPSCALLLPSPSSAQWTPACLPRPSHSCMTVQQHPPTPPIAPVSSSSSRFASMSLWALTLGHGAHLCPSLSPHPEVWQGPRASPHLVTLEGPGHPDLCTWCSGVWPCQDLGRACMGQGASPQAGFPSVSLG